MLQVVQENSTSLAINRDACLFLTTLAQRASRRTWNSRHAPQRHKGPGDIRSRRRDRRHTVYEAELAQIRKTIPIAVNPNATAASGSSMSIAACEARSLLPQTAKSPMRQSWNETSFGWL